MKLSEAGSLIYEEIQWTIEITTSTIRNMYRLIRKEWGKRFQHLSAKVLSVLFSFYLPALAS
jgi:hypothetical protein